jgi:hypothetical protein
MVLLAKGFALTFAHCSAMPLGVIVGRTIAVDSKGNIFIAEVEGKVHKFELVN